MKGDQIKQDTKLDLKEAFRKYAQRELEFYKNAEKDKLYQRTLPNMKDKTKGMIDFYYNGIIVGGYIDTNTNTIVLNKLKVTKSGKEGEVPATIKLIEDKFKETEIVCDNQLK